MNCLRVINSSFQRYSLFKMPYVRYGSQHPLKFLETQERWKEKDGMSQRWDLIYKAPMDKALNFMSTYLTFTTTTIAGSAIYYAAFVFDVNTINEPVIIGEDVVIANNGMECLIYLGAFVIFHAAVKTLLSKYVIRLYKNGDDYVAIFRGNWFNQIKKHKFHLDDFKKLNPTFVVSWGNARFDLGNKHGILLDNYFKTPEYFNYLLYKKPSHTSKE